MEFLEIPLYDDDVIKLLVRFGINLFFLSLVVRFAIYPSQRQRDFAFTAVMLNITVFFICFTLKKLEIDIGMALGLFAIFGVLRYRTDTIGTREMTYLFIVIGLAVINSLANKKTSYMEVALVNLLILSGAILKEWIGGRLAPDIPKKKRNGEGAGKASKYTIQYDKIEWLGVASRPLLLNDLRIRTGMQITEVQVKSIDLQNDNALLNVWCDEYAASPDSPAPPIER